MIEYNDPMIRVVNQQQRENINILVDSWKQSEGTKLFVSELKRKREKLLTDAEGLAMTNTPDRHDKVQQLLCRAFELREQLKDLSK